MTGAPFDDCRMSVVPAAAAGLMACLLLVGCGAVGEPLYPALYIPTAVSDLTAVEHGPNLEIHFTLPTSTTEGLVVKQIGSIDLRVGANTQGGFQADHWALEAQRVSVPVPDQPGAVSATTPAAPFAGKEVVVAVRVGNAKGRMSDWSNLAVFHVVEPLATPVDFRAVPVPTGVKLTWTAPGQASFRILRKTGEEQHSSQLAVANQSEYTDTTTEYGKTYEYWVQGAHDQAESQLAGPVSVSPTDIFAPAVPAGLTAAAGVGTIELAWERNTEPDFKEYRVYRAGPEGTFTQIAEGLEGPSYSDRKVESGKRYRYRITAMDQTGNESAPSPPVEIIAP